MTRTLVALCLAVLVGAPATSLLGCSSEQAPATEPPRELVVFAAASLRDAFGAVGTMFEREHPGVTVRFSFAGTQELRTQLELGARADLLASADEQHMDALRSAGLVGPPRLFAHNELVLVVSREAAATLRSLADLPDARRVVIGAPNVPVGRYTLMLLQRAEEQLGRDFDERVLARVVSRELNVRQVLHKVSIGEADAGFVYRSDARSAGDSVSVVELPSSSRVVAAYPIAVSAHAAQPELAQAFVALLLSPAGQEALTAAGFMPSDLP